MNGEWPPAKVCAAGPQLLPVTREPVTLPALLERPGRGAVTVALSAFPLTIN